MSPQLVGVLVWSTKVVDGQLVDCTSVELNAQVYYTLVDCNCRPNSNSITSICSGLVVRVVTTLHCHAAVGKI